MSMLKFDNKIIQNSITAVNFIMYINIIETRARHYLITPSRNFLGYLPHPPPPIYHLSDLPLTFIVCCVSR